MRPAEAILLALASYAAIGLLVGLAFVVRGITRADPAARGTRWTFRALILPGAAALWPFTLILWARARRAIPEPHP